MSKSDQGGWFRGDRPLIWILAFVDILLILIARQYFNSLNNLATQYAYLHPVDVEKQELDHLEQLAEKGSWAAFENARSEKVSYYLQSDIRPSPGIALYFYPETLPATSLERDFAIRELKSSIEKLKVTFKNRQQNQIDQAYQQLQTRVTNYEVGTSGDFDAISDEAKRFLGIYKKFVAHNKDLNEK